ncbi:Uncharacterised protein [Mycobacteroides abscessus subsp. abscessus]|nr:Uncharacterised protein [Mycobacteroides abscessus subsp. abscessus]
MSAVYGSNRFGSGTATVSLSSGNRTRSFLALRKEDPVEATFLTSSMAATSAASAGNTDSDTQSVRCTDRSPVSPRQMTSVVIGSSGAARRHVVSSTVCNVSMASASSSQKRERDRRTYQLVSASVNCRSCSHATETSQSSMDLVRSSRSCASFARMYLSSTCFESVRQVPGLGAYSCRKLQAFHSGRMTCRTPSRIPCSVTIRLPPRKIGDAMRNQRIASDPSRSNTSLTSG